MTGRSVGLDLVNPVVPVRAEVHRAIGRDSHTRGEVRRWQARASFKANRQIGGNHPFVAIGGVHLGQLPFGRFGHDEFASRCLRQTFRSSQTFGLQLLVSTRIKRPAISVM